MLWHVPMKEVLAVYNRIQFTPSSVEMLACMNLFFAGAYAEWLVADLVYQYFSQHSTFLTENIHHHYQGGLDDMAFQTSDKWRQVYQQLHNTSNSSVVYQSEQFKYKNSEVQEETLGEYKWFKQYISQKYSSHLSIKQETTFSFNTEVHSDIVDALRQEYLDYF